MGFVYGMQIMTWCEYVVECGFNAIPFPLRTDCTILLRLYNAKWSTFKRPGPSRMNTRCLTCVDYSALLATDESEFTNNRKNSLFNFCCMSHLAALSFALDIATIRCFRPVNTKIVCFSSVADSAVDGSLSVWCIDHANS